MKAAKPWPVEEMKEMYTSGKSLQEIADILDSDEWQEYWIRHTGEKYCPSAKVVNKVLNRHMTLRGRGAPGSRNGSWKGGVRQDKRGYRLVYKPDHPFAAKNGCVREHRLVAESVIGRYLLPEEVVHHRDEDPENNDIDNLMIYSTNAKHVSETLAGKSSDGQKKGLARAHASHSADYDPDLYWPFWLLDFLHADKLSLNQIADLLQCDKRSVAKHLDRHGLHSRVKKAGTVTEEHRELCRRFLANLQESKRDDQESLA